MALEEPDPELRAALERVRTLEAQLVDARANLAGLYILLLGYTIGDVVLRDTVRWHRGRNRVETHQYKIVEIRPRRYFPYGMVPRLKASDGWSKVVCWVGESEIKEKIGHE